MMKSISIPINMPSREHTGDPNYLPNEVRLTIGDDFIAIADSGSRIDLSRLQVEQLVEELSAWIRTPNTDKPWSNYWTDALR